MPKRHTLNRIETEQILSRTKASLEDTPYDPPAEPDRAEVMKTKRSKIYFFNGKALFVERSNKIVPSILNKEALDMLPSIIVDQGAIPYICNGADVMAPGITEIQGEFPPEALTVIREEKYEKALAIGIAIIGSEDMKKQTRGRVVENIHYISDDAWQGYL